MILRIARKYHGFVIFQDKKYFTMAYNYGTLMDVDSGICRMTSRVDGNSKSGEHRQR